MQDNFPAIPNLNNLSTAQARISAMPKVTPEVMMLVYLDEVAGRLAEIHEELAKQNADGFLQSGQYTITDNPIKLVTVGRYISIYNEGLNPVYVSTQKSRAKAGIGEAPIRVGGELSIDMGTRKLRTFWISCTSGLTSTVSTYTW